MERVVQRSGDGESRLEVRRWGVVWRLGDGESSQGQVMGRVIWRSGGGDLSRGREMGRQLAGGQITEDTLFQVQALGRRWADGEELSGV